MPNRNATDRPAPRRWLLVAVAVSLLAGTAIAVISLVGGDDRSARQADVARRGAAVMPFDLDRTTHVFTPTPAGGAQRVVADDPRDRRQIRLIREHLTKEAGRFRAGDFDDPAAIHGDVMPGLAGLRASYTKVEVRYAERPDGAEIVYTSRDAIAVDALHAWFQAQVSDHGEHAEHN